MTSPVLNGRGCQASVGAWRSRSTMPARKRQAEAGAGLNEVLAGVACRGPPAPLSLDPDPPDLGPALDAGGDEREADPPREVPPDLDGSRHRHVARLPARVAEPGLQRGAVGGGELAAPGIAIPCQAGTEGPEPSQRRVVLRGAPGWCASTNRYQVACRPLSRPYHSGSGAHSSSWRSTSSRGSRTSRPPATSLRLGVYPTTSPKDQSTATRRQSIPMGRAARWRCSRWRGTRTRRPG